MFAMLDADGDGHFSPPEFAAHHGLAPGSLAVGDWATRWQDPRGMTEAELAAAVGGGADDAPVQQIHIALTGNPTEMQVQYVGLTREACSTARVGVRVRGGGGDFRWHGASSRTYTVPRRWWEPEGWIGFVYTAVLRGLIPRSEYEYHISNCGDEANNTGELHFRAAAVEGTLPVTMGVFGDMGTAVPLGFEVTRRLVAAQRAGRGFDATMLFGDISYAGVDTAFPALNMSKSDEIQAVWDLFGRQNEPLGREVPFMVGVGNHDMFYSAAAMSTRWTMPGPASGGEGNFWWSTNVGGVHLVSISSEHDYGARTSPQWRWLAGDLAAANGNRARVPWVVLAVHRPMYSSDADGWNAHSPGCALQTSIEPLLLQHRVDLVLAGHQHCYEHVLPVRNGTVLDRPTQQGGPGCEAVYRNPRGPPHITLGTAGAAQAESWRTPQPPWSHLRLANGRNPSAPPGDGWHYEDTFGYGRLTAHNASHLSLRFVPIRGSLDDCFWIVKDASHSAAAPPTPSAD